MFISRFIQANYFKKYLAENAVNTISEPLDFKIFWGGLPPDLPTNSRLQRSFSAPPLSNTLRRPCEYMKYQIFEVLLVRKMWCSALLTELSSHLGAGHFVSSWYARRSWKEGERRWKCHWDKIVDIHFFYIFVDNKSIITINAENCTNIRVKFFYSLWELQYQCYCNFKPCGIFESMTSFTPFFNQDWNKEN